MPQIIAKVMPAPDLNASFFFVFHVFFKRKETLHQLHKKEAKDSARTGVSLISLKTRCTCDTNAQNAVRE